MFPLYKLFADRVSLDCKITWGSLSVLHVEQKGRVQACVDPLVAGTLFVISLLEELGNLKDAMMQKDEERTGSEGGWNWKSIAEDTPKQIFAHLLTTQMFMVE